MERTAGRIHRQSAVDGFVFASSKRDVINCLYRGGSSWRGMEAYESRIYYGADGVERVEISLYNKGDDSRECRWARMISMRC